MYIRKHNKQEDSIHEMAHNMILGIRIIALVEILIVYCTRNQHIPGGNKHVRTLHSLDNPVSSAACWSKSSISCCQLRVTETVRIVKKNRISSIPCISLRLINYSPAKLTKEGENVINCTWFISELHFTGVPRPHFRFTQIKSVAIDLKNVFLAMLVI